MPLITSMLKAELVTIYEKGQVGNPSPEIVGIKTAQAYLKYVSAGIDMGGGTFVSMLGISKLGTKLGDIFSTSNGISATQGYAIARAFNSCLHTFKTNYQIAISTAPGFPTMLNGMAKLLSTPNSSSTSFAQKFANYLSAYTSTAIITGLIPGTPPIPFAGPIK